MGLGDSLVDEVFGKDKGTVKSVMFIKTKGTATF